MRAFTRSVARSLAVIGFALLISQHVSAYYLPGSFPNEYKVNATMMVKVNSLTSTMTELPFAYYTLPYCHPQEGVKNVAENLGEVLMGDIIENSPYIFHMLWAQFGMKLCTTPPLGHNQFKSLKTKIMENYRVNMILDNLPITTSALDDGVGDVMTGFPVGYVSNDDSQKVFVNNHLQFTVLYHTVIPRPGDDLSLGPGYMVVGFEVKPCSIDWESSNSEGRTVTNVRNAGMYDKLRLEGKVLECGALHPQEVREGGRITFSYDIKWEASPVQWVSRWDSYLKMEGSQVHWFSIVNSFMVVCFLSGIIFVILLKTVRRDLSQYEEMLTEKGEDIKEDSGWKLVSGDVFRAPPMLPRLCTHVGSGVQIFGMLGVTIIFAALGFMSPAARGSLLTSMVVVYLLLAVVAGYTAVRLYTTLKSSSEGWKMLCWRVACFFPGIAFFFMLIINIFLWHTGSSGTIPFLVFFTLIFLWFALSVPLSLMGGYMAAKQPPVEMPTRTNQIPRQIPEQRFSALALIVGAGILPFGTMFIELYFIMSSIWMHHTYYVFGFLLIVLVFLAIICAEVSIVLTYVQLCAEDYRWMWRAFVSSGSVALYTLIYAMGYLVFDLHHLSGGGLASIVMYLGYMSIIIIGIYLFTGTIGFCASYYFVYKLFASVKMD